MPLEGKKLAHLLSPGITKSRERLDERVMGTVPSLHGEGTGKAVSTHALRSWESKRCYFPLISKIVCKCHCWNIL